MSRQNEKENVPIVPVPIVPHLGKLTLGRLGLSKIMLTFAH